MEKTIIDVWAEWCQPCKMLAPILEHIEKDYDVVIEKVDVTNDLSFCENMEIRNIPTMILAIDGKEVDRIVGFRPAAEIVKKFSLNKRSTP